MPRYEQSAYNSMIFTPPPFWSLPQEEVQLTDGVGDKALPDVTIASLPAGAVVVWAFCHFVPRIIENTNIAANYLSGAQEIQIRTDAPGDWTDCINFVDTQYGIAASTREAALPAFGKINVAAVVTGNDTYNFQWDEAIAFKANLQFNDCYMCIVLGYSI